VAAFEHVRRLNEVHDHLTANELKPDFVFNGDRIPLINPQRGIFKPQQMRFLLSIKTVFPKPGGKVWYDDQREVHRQIFASDETIDYAFMGQDPNAADNRWLHGEVEDGLAQVLDLVGARGGQLMMPNCPIRASCSPDPVGPCHGLEDGLYRRSAVCVTCCLKEVA
jgi:putative restriction endonuclease